MPQALLHADSRLALLADRDVDSRQMYAEYLRRASYEVDEADDGRQALAKAIARNPDVVVTETRLPGIDGFELCRLLRDDDLTQTIPIIVVTADAFQTDVSRAEQAGADIVLTKPCLPETLLAEIRRLRAKSEQLRQRAREVRLRLAEHIVKSDLELQRSRQLRGRVMLSRDFKRHETTEPSAAPPALVCPMCDTALTYRRSHIGGVSERHAEQWDYYECPAGCGSFQYRQRTRKLRRVV